MQYVYDFLGYDIESQLTLALYALMLGASLGAFFDVLRITRVFLAYRTDGVHQDTAMQKVLFALCLIEDVAFAVISAVVLVLFCFKANGGTSRGYILFGALVGFSLYLLSIGRLTRMVSKALAKAFHALLSFLTKRVILPVVACVDKILRTLYKKTFGRAYACVLRRYYAQNTKKTSRELTKAIRLLTNHAAVHRQKKGSRG